MEKIDLKTDKKRLETEWTKGKRKKKFNQRKKG